MIVRTDAPPTGGWAVRHAELKAERERPTRTLHRSPQHIQGYRQAAKAAVEWLHNEAETMNDPKARAILNAAAHGLGVHFKRTGSTESEAR